MKQITKYIGMVAILSIFALATVSGNIGEADAAKAEGSPGIQSPKSYGSATDDIVCGDKLCASGENPDPVNEGKAN
jgi:hypothetical protein